MAINKRIDVVQRVLCSLLLNIDNIHRLANSEPGRRNLIPTLKRLNLKYTKYGYEFEVLQQEQLDLDNTCEMCGTIKTCSECGCEDQYHY